MTPISTGHQKSYDCYLSSEEFAKDREESLGIWWILNISVRYLDFGFVVVHMLSHVWLCAPWTAACQASLSITISKLMSTEWVMLSNHPILCCALLVLPSIFASIRVFPGGSGNLPAIQETQVGSLGQEDPLEKTMATYFSILACKIPCTDFG